MSKMLNSVLIALLVLEVSQTYAQTNGGLPAIIKNNGTHSTNDKSNQQPHPTLQNDKRQKYVLQVLGEQINFTNPPGYCSPGQSKRERDLVATSQSLLNSSVKLLHSAYLCDELVAYRNSERDTVDHWIQVQVLGLGPNNSFVKLSIAREVFLARTSDSIQQVDFDKIIKNNQIHNRKFNIDLIDGILTPMGRDGNAFYMSVKSTLSTENVKKRITGFSAITLINSVPLNVAIYESAGTIKSQEELPTLLKSALSRLLTDN